MVAPRLSIPPVIGRTGALLVGAGKPARQARDFATRLLLGDAKIVSGLKIEAELRTGLQPMAQAKRGVPRNGPVAPDDLGDAVRRHRDWRDSFRSG